jgi:type I restriction enzyme, S subunit
LELAVRGKLVPQDDNDEPASVLLEKIAVEKAQLIKKGRIKKVKVRDKINEDEKSFELPRNWSWIRLSNIYDVRDGTHDSPKYQASGYPLVTSKNLASGTLSLDDVKYISTKDHQKIAERSAVVKGDILFAMIGTIGNPVIVDIDDEFSIKNVALFKPINGLLNSMQFLRIQLIVASKYLKNNASGAVQKFASLTKLREQAVALPPLAEQQRIVAKVDELMLLCDHLEQQTEASIEAHATLVEVLLGTLTDSVDADELAQNWARISEHFDSLFTTEQSIDALKQTVLQLAVMGQLVPQNPDDEPASVLLEKERLIRESKIKQPSSWLEITENEKPFESPESWIWLRFGDVYPLEYGNNLPKPKRSNTGEYNVYGSNGIVGSHNAACVKSSCIVVGRKGSAGALNISLDDGCWVTDVAYSCIPIKGIDLYFAFMHLKTLGLDSLGKGIKPGLNRNEAYSLPVAIPPLSEQHLIVAKVDELMAICDQLKEKLQQSQETQVQLTDALVDRALE